MSVCNSLIMLVMLFNIMYVMRNTLCPLNIMRPLRASGPPAGPLPLGDLYWAPLAGCCWHGYRSSPPHTLFCALL